MTTPRPVDLVSAVKAALATPEKVMARLAPYEIAEQKGRHTKLKMSILYYALAGYLTAEVPFPERFTLGFVVTDEDVEVSGTPRPDTETTGPFTIHVAHPQWLADFFLPEERFNLLLPTDTTPLADTLSDLYGHLETYGVTAPAPANAPAEAAESDDEEWDDDEEEEDETVIPDEILMPEEQEPEDDAPDAEEEEADPEYDAAAEAEAAECRQP